MVALAPAEIRRTQATALMEEPPMVAAEAAAIPEGQAVELRRLVDIQPIPRPDMC